MNNINPIFEALSGVDERHVPIAQEKRPAKKLKLALIAAVSAATLALIVGFTTATVRGQHRFGFSSGNSANHTFDLELTPQEFTIPDEFMSQLEYGVGQIYADTTPNELIRSFGITPLINDNFSDTDKKPRVDILADGEDQTVDFVYSLYDKNIGMTVIFKATYFSETENLTYNGHIELLPGEPSKVITLNNGSLCMVTGSRAEFSYNGAKFGFDLLYEYNAPDNYGELPESEQKKILAEMTEAMPGIDTVKQVLADLGVL